MISTKQTKPLLASIWHRISQHGTCPRYLLGLSCALLLSACAGTPLVEDMEGYNTGVETSNRFQQVVAMQTRLDRVSGPLLVNNARLCRKQSRNLLGFSATNKYSYLPSDPESIAQTTGLGEQLQISHIIPGSGAARAGLQRGDILLKINGQPVPQGKNAEAETVALLSPIVTKNTPVSLTVQRQAKNRKLQIPLTPACGFRVELGQTDNVSAYSDGQRILITRGMMRFVRSDKELAYVISKEMAHNILGHTRILKNGDAARTMIDTLLQSNSETPPDISNIKPFSGKQDIDADTLSFAIAARGGYDIDHALAFWTRLAKKYPGAVTGSYTELHPSNEARLEDMSRLIARIKSLETKRKTRPGRGS